MLFVLQEGSGGDLPYIKHIEALNFVLQLFQSRSISGFAVEWFVEYEICIYFYV